MYESIENGMILGAPHEWELLNTPTLWESHRDTDLLDYLYERGYDVRAMAEMLHLNAYSMQTANALSDLFDDLPTEMQLRMAEDYVDSHRLQLDFIEWKRGYAS